MTNVSTTIAGMILLMSFLATASEISTDDEVLMLQQEIKRQEVVLVALKERLRSISKTEMNTFHIKVTSDSLEFKGVEISVEDIQDKLKLVSEDDKIVISADPNTPHHRMVALLNEFHEAGYKNVSLKTKQSEQ
jgi:biopolymer transport protein ExbD